MHGGARETFYMAPLPSVMCWSESGTINGGHLGFGHELHVVQSRKCVLLAVAVALLLSLLVF